MNTRNLVFLVDWSSIKRDLTTFDEILFVAPVGGSQKPFLPPATPVDIVFIGPPGRTSSCNLRTSEFRLVTLWLFASGSSTRLQTHFLTERCPLAGRCVGVLGFTLPGQLGKSKHVTVNLTWGVTEGAEANFPAEGWAYIIDCVQRCQRGPFSDFLCLTGINLPLVHCHEHVCEEDMYAQC